MEKILGIIQGEMEKDHINPVEHDIKIINSLSNPPLVPVSKDEIYVRRCRLASDAIDCGFGRFRTESLPALLDLTQGVPMLIGHKKDGVGIARFFGGEIEELHDVYNPFTRNKERIAYIVPKFYWMKDHSQAEDLRVNIDGGIYNQVSISWWYGKATCGICGKDMRVCEHVPGRVYDDKPAFFYYDDIYEVLEGSIVYAGGQPFTGFYLDAEQEQGLEESRKIYSAGVSLTSDSKAKIYRKDVENYLKSLSGKIDFKGRLKDEGWSDGSIDIVCDSGLKQQVIQYLPPVFLDRVRFIGAVESGCSFSFDADKKGRTFSRKEEDENFISNNVSLPVVFTCNQLPALTSPVYVEPLYDGIPVTVQRYGKDITIFDSGGRDISQRVSQIMQDMLEYPSHKFVIHGIIVSYRGRIRLDYPATYHVLESGDNHSDLRAKLKIFDICSLGEASTADIPFYERRKLLESFFHNTRCVHVVNGEIADNEARLRSLIDRISSRDGAVIKDWEGIDGAESVLCTIRKKPVLEVKVVDRESAPEGYRYACALVEEGAERIIGKTISSPLIVEDGEIVRVEVLRTRETGGIMSIEEARVVSRLQGKISPDSSVVFRALMESLTFQGTGKSDTFQASEQKGGDGVMLSLRFQYNDWTGLLRYSDVKGGSDNARGYVLVGEKDLNSDCDSVIRRGNVTCLYESEKGISLLLKPEDKRTPLIVWLMPVIHRKKRRWLGIVKSLA